MESSEDGKTLKLKALYRAPYWVPYSLPYWVPLIREKVRRIISLSAGLAQAPQICQACKPPPQELQKN